MVPALMRNLMRAQGVTFAEREARRSFLKQDPGTLSEEGQPSVRAWGAPGKAVTEAAGCRASKGPRDPASIRSLDGEFGQIWVKVPPTLAVLLGGVSSVEEPAADRGASPGGPVPPMEAGLHLTGPTSRDPQIPATVHQRGGTSDMAR